MSALALQKCFSWFIWVLFFLAGGCPTVLAQTPGLVVQQFDGNICGWRSTSPVTLTFDPTQHVGDSSGSCYVSDNFAEAGVFYINASYVSCCACALGLELYLNHYGSVEFDLKWDTTSTVTPAQFNTGPAGTVGGLNISGCMSPVLIPDAATDGWVHITAPIDPASLYATNISIGIFFTSTFAAPPDLPTGKAAFWIDNVALGVLSPHMIPTSAGPVNNDFTLQWTAAPGASCSVLKSTDLLNWTTLVTGYPPGGLTNGLGSYIDTHATNPRAFYRVSVP